MSSKRLKKLRTLREKRRRLTKKVAKLENIITELKTKSLISEEDGDLMGSVEPANRLLEKKIFKPRFQWKKIFSIYKSSGLQVCTITI